ncbi:forkhead-associated domain-containing protein 1 isoform X2 [Sceloporus undulatus]|uniref:forkhead-associated domain-containing protein 1 isoform X2 n=1 Tax=Sceloporus undulatus TaxID=8520 RepID=UPI001C4D365B|nr:forkhead-associated domain-containing protein 1 isoform X2 [Sceloporus undulatus]
MKAFLKGPDSIWALRPKITLIGRHEDADIILKSAGIEDHHAALEFSEAENSFVLRDFNSAQGTFVNDCQIQNAAVKVGPGDVLHFGPNGAAFELVLDNAPQQVSYPPVGRRLAWPGQLQIVTETRSPPAVTAPSQFPSLASQSSPPTSRSWSYVSSGASPHPPRRKKPINAWGRAIASPSFSPDAFTRPSAVVGGDGGATGPLTNVHQGDTLLKERDEMILKLGNEIGRLSAFESECNRKDLLIANLQNEIAAMAEKLAAAAPKREAEFHQKLLGLEEEVAAKAEEIKALREQIKTLQKNTSEVMYHSLSERDLQIAHWKQETETLKKSYSLTTGLVTSLQKDMTWKDQKIQQLKMEGEKLRRENREKDSQLAHISAQCSRIKEETKRELREREVNAYENHVAELELQVRRSEDDMKKCRAEQDTLANQLAEKTKAEGELRDECERKAQQLQEMGRRERLMKSDMDRAATQAQGFRNQIAEILFFQLPEKSVTDQEIMEKIQQIQAANVEYCQKEMELREEMHVNESEMEEMSENVATLKKALDRFQDFLQTPYCSNSLRKEISGLQNTFLVPPVSDVQAAVAKILDTLLNWVDATEGLLRDVGLDGSGSGKGMPSYMKQLRDLHCNTMGQLQTLQDQLKMAKDSQDTMLQERLKELQEKLEEEFQGKEREDLEVEKEHRKVLEGMAALEEAKWKEAIGEEKKRVEDLETRAKQLSEALEEKAKSEAAANARVTETLESLEAAERRKTLVEEKLMVCEKRLESLEKENEAQKRKHQEETSEYKEQVKQHSRTIVDLESKYVEAARHAKKSKEENGNLQKQIEEMQRKSCRSLPACLQETISPEESHSFWREELRAARQKVLSSEAVMAELKKELSEARARVSDAIGELSEKQKMELEQKQSLVHSQGQEILQLQEKLFEMSNLVDQKDSDLKIVRGELR